jgi:hypothetical protein
VFRLHLLGNVKVGPTVARSYLGVHGCESVHPNKSHCGAEQAGHQRNPDRASLPPGADHCKLVDDNPRDHDSPFSMGSLSLVQSASIAAMTFIKFTDFLPKLMAVAQIELAGNAGSGEEFA